MSDTQRHSALRRSGAPSDGVVPWRAYLSGSGEAPKYDPDALVREGRVVVVTVSYRLGIFGYLNPCAGGEENLGLRDQIMALRWTQRHIAAFGGDPSQVTIFGQSAGGDSVMSLILSKQTTGLFHRAILQSAPLGLRNGREAMTAAMRDAVTGALAGVAPGEASVEQLLNAQTAAVTTAQRFGLLGGFPFAPIAGMDPLPPARDESRKLADAASRVEVLVGYTRNDADAFVAVDSRGQRLQRFGPPGRAITRLLGDVMTRRIFGRPALELAKSLQAVATPALFERIDERCHDAGTASAERVADGDGPAVDVGLAQIGAGVMRPRQRRTWGAEEYVQKRLDTEPMREHTTQFARFVGVGAYLRIARPQGRNHDHRRDGDVRIRPNRPGPNRTRTP